uniref:Filamin-like 3 n=1 Tax=Halisarca dujardinii TaxID=2583056 RepID=A0A9F1U433_HALDU|nr:filamin-like 3 [Halisarca dujardinii]
MAEADWKRIQKKTFTRWCNEHLKQCGMIIDDLGVDLGDGLKLISLLKVLSRNSASLKRYNKKPRIRAQMLENVQVALDFIAFEKVKLVNIGTADIVDSNMKLILGLVWTLILHYQISMGFGLTDDKGSRKSTTTPKQALLNYVKGQVTIPNKQIRNFTSDWNDGTLVAALVDATAPGLCPECAVMEPQNALENASRAMKLAEDWLGVPQLLLPEDMVNPNVDELSVMTYVSMFPEAQLKEGAPIKLSGSDPSKVKVYGRGVESEGVSTDDATAEFTVEVSEAGVGKLSVTLEGPEGQDEVIVTDKKYGTYTCSYVPRIHGTYRITILWSGKQVPLSPIQVNVAQGSDASVCRAHGPGLEASHLKEDCETEFWVETEGAGEGTLSLSIRGPKGPVIGEEYMRVEDEGSGKFHIFYTPPSAGQYIIEILFGGLHVDQSPFKVHIGQDRADASKCRAEGDGITGKDLEVGKMCTFWVYTKGAGRGELLVNIRNQVGQVPIQCKSTDEGVCEYTYMPEEDGEYVLTVKYGGENIPGSRFKVNVEPPTDPSKCVASGPGLEIQGVRVNIPTKFEVRTKGAGHGDLDVAITGPEGNQIIPDCVTSPYTYDYTYEANFPGIYTVDATYANQHIPGSPYRVAITDTNKVRITGPGMKGEFLPIEGPLEYFIDAREAGPGKVACSVQGPMRPDDYDQSAPKITDNGDGTFLINYTPVDAGRLKMNATFAEAAIPETPVKLHVYDASQVVAEGKGLEDGNISGEITTFGVDMRKGGEGRLAVSIDGPSRTPVTIKDQANNMVKCEYIPLVPGDYDINVFWEGVHIPNSPYHIGVRPAIDPSAVVCYGEGLEGGNLFTDMWAEFHVDFKKAGKGELQVRVNGPGGGEELDTEDVEEGLRKVRYYIDPEEAGEYSVDVLFAEQPIPGSPFKVNTAWKTDPTKVKAYGIGLEGGIVKQWMEFTLDMSKAGSGNLALSIEGPSEAEVKVDDKGSGIAVVQFYPEEPGEYKVNVAFADEPIPCSPFTPVFEPCTDASKVTASGPGIQPRGVRVGDPGSFTVDTSLAGPGALDVAVDGPISRSETPVRNLPAENSSSPGGSGKRPSTRRRNSSFRSSARPHITNNNDDTYTVQYNPRKVGQYSVVVTYDGVNIASSPFTVFVTEPDKVKVNGPGIVDDEDCILCVGDQLVFAVDTGGAGEGEIEAVLTNPKGEKVPAEVEKVTDENFVVKVVPDQPGTYSMDMAFSGTELPCSPVQLKVVDPAAVVVDGEHLNGEPVQVGTPIEFSIDASMAGEGKLGVYLEGPSELNVQPESQEEGKLKFSIDDIEAGDYKLRVAFAGKPVTESPEIISLYDPTKVTASGPGITGEGAQVGIPAKVVVDATKAGKAPLTASIKYPNGEEATLELQPDQETPGVFEGEYTPEQPGAYDVAIMLGDVPISSEPLRTFVGNPNAVKIRPPEIEEEFMAEWVDGAESAPDVLPLFATVNTPSSLDVYTDNAGPGQLDATFKPLTGSDDVKVDFHFDELEPDHYLLRFTPHEAEDLELEVLFNGFPIGEPQKIVLSDPRKCSAFGAGLKSGLLANEDATFTIQSVDAGPGIFSAHIFNPDNEEIPLEMEMLGKNDCQITYKPEMAGEYQVVVCYAKGNIENSPFTVAVCDPQAVVASGPGLNMAIVDEEAEFSLDLSKAGEGSLGISLEGPKRTEVHCSDNEDGTLRVSYTPTAAGLYKFIVKFADVEIPGSAFPVCVERTTADASKCVVKDLETPGSFLVDASMAGGNGKLEVCAVGAFVPVNFITVTHNGDYTFNIKYSLPEPGETWISVKWHEVPVPGSPFTVTS